MEMRSIAKQLQENSYPGRGIIIGKTSDGSKAVTEERHRHQGHNPHRIVGVVGTHDAG